jgi:predicted nucleic acid-binding protein
MTATKSQFDFVLDCSFTMAWCFEDEGNQETEAVLDKFKTLKATVPTIWPLEVANVLLIAKKNRRITEVHVASFIDAISSLPIIVDQSTSLRAMHSIFAFASETGLTIYDAAYLELALREKIPLLTLDKDLLKAAKKLHVKVSL